MPTPEAPPELLPEAPGPGRPIICLVTDSGRLFPAMPPADRLEALVERIARAAGAGVDLVQIRERHLTDRALYDLAVRVVERTRGTGTHVVVNDRTDIALAAGAAGVHLRADSPDPSRIRTMTPPGFVVGRSIHAVEEAVALAGGVDYFIFGTVFGSRSKPGLAPTDGIERLRRVCQVAGRPVLAIGGVTPERLPALAGAGAAGFAGIDFFDEPPDGGGQSIEYRIREARAAFRQRENGPRTQA